MSRKKCGSWIKKSVYYILYGTFCPLHRNFLLNSITTIPLPLSSTIHIINSVYYLIWPSYFRRYRWIERVRTPISNLIGVLVWSGSRSAYWVRWLSERPRISYNFSTGERETRPKWSIFVFLVFSQLYTDRVTAALPQWTF